MFKRSTSLVLEAYTDADYVGSVVEIMLDLWLREDRPQGIVPFLVGT